MEHFGYFIGKHVTAGYYGVDLFFVISGFLVTGVLLTIKKESFKENYIHFIGRRTLRIFPIYYLTILILWMVGVDAVEKNLFSLLTYTFNYASIHNDLRPNPVFQFWSLAVEEQFYLLWPFIIIPLRKKSSILLGIIATLVIIGYSQQIFSIFPRLSAYNYVSLLTRMASLGLGAFGAVLAAHNLLPEKLLKSKFIEYLILSLLLLTLLLNYKIKLLVLGFCSLYLVLKASFFNFSYEPFNKFLSNKYIMYIGTISYGIYIFHGPISFYFQQYVFDPFWLQINFETLGRLRILEWHPWVIKFPLYSLLSLGVAAFSYKYFEMPILKLKDRLFKY